MNNTGEGALDPVGGERAAAGEGEDDREEESDALAHRKLLGLEGRMDFTRSSFGPFCQPNFRPASAGRKAS